MSTPALASLTDRARRRCQCCERTALWGTAGHDAAVDPRNCPRCDHSYAVSLAGGNPYFDRAGDSELFVVPSALPAVVEFEAPAPPPPSRFGRRVEVYALALLDDAPVSPGLPIACGEMAGYLLDGMTTKPSLRDDADRARRIVSDACGVTL